MMPIPNITKTILILVLLSLLAAGCRPPAPAAPADTAQPPAVVPESSPTAPEPTATPQPLAVQVNQGGVLLADYEAELLRYQEAQKGLGREPGAEEARQAVLDELIDQELLAQAALQAGQVVDDAAVQARSDRLAEQMGGQPALDDWIARSGYTPDTFRAALRLALLAAWQRDQILSAVPETAEQVHARQILMLDAGEAAQIAGQVQAGADFATLAYRYDPLTGGDLGWFPRGVLAQPEVEDAVFALQPGQVTPVVKSSVGYHLVLVTEREQDHPLDPANRQKLQEKALRAWLDQRRAESQVNILVN